MSVSPIRLPWSSRYRDERVGGCGVGTVPPWRSAKATRLSWNTSQGKTTGKAVEKKTKDFTHQGQDFKPTDDDPYWIVESEKSGSQAAHKGVLAQ